MCPHNVARCLTQRHLTLGHPRLNVNESVIASRENRTEPDRRDSPKRQALPVAMSRKMGVQYFGQSHPLHLRQQQRNVIDALGDDRWFVIHPQSLTQSGI
jgi:hypothetical protein